MSPILYNIVRAFDPGALVDGATQAVGDAAGAATKTVKDAGAQQTGAIVDVSD
jgi:hypothetical protein